MDTKSYFFACGAVCEMFLRFGPLNNRLPGGGENVSEFYPLIIEFAFFNQFSFTKCREEKKQDSIYTILKIYTTFPTDRLVCEADL